MELAMRNNHLSVRQFIVMARFIMFSFIFMAFWIFLFRGLSSKHCQFVSFKKPKAPNSKSQIPGEK